MPKQDVDCELPKQMTRSERLTSLGFDQSVGQGSLIIFARLSRFYKTFLVLAALVSALSAGVLQFPEVGDESIGKNKWLC